MRALKGRSIVIIGGTSGLGLSAAKACAAAGARLVVLGRADDHAQVARRELGGDAVVLTGDAATAEAAEEAVETAIARHGGIDGLYHVAGGSGRSMGDGPLHEMTDAGIDFTLRLNLASVMHSNRAAVRRMISAGRGGAIVNLASVLAESPAPAFFSTHAYAAAKAGVIGLTRAAAACYAPQNIRFNCLAPGLVATPMSQRAQGSEAIMDYIATKQPLDGGRIGRPEDLDDAAVFLLSDGARFITGQVLAIDGGWSVTEGRA